MLLEASCLKWWLLHLRAAFLKLGLRHLKGIPGLCCYCCSISHLFVSLFTEFFWTLCLPYIFNGHYIFGAWGEKPGFENGLFISVVSLCGETVLMNQYQIHHEYCRVSYADGFEAEMVFRTIQYLLLDQLLELGEIGTNVWTYQTTQMLLYRLLSKFPSKMPL